MAVLSLTGGQNTGRNAVPIYPLGAVAVTKSDSDEFAKPVALYVGTTGNVVVEPWDTPGATVTFTAVPAGVMVPCMVRRVMAATTASNMVAVY